LISEIDGPLKFFEILVVNQKEKTEIEIGMAAIAANLKILRDLCFFLSTG